MLFANQSLPALFSLDAHLGSVVDPQNDTLRGKLAKVDIAMVSAADQVGNLHTSAWNWMESGEKGGPCRVVAQEGVSAEKGRLLSLHKVSVNVFGHDDKLIVVRDLGPLSRLQDALLDKQQFAFFAERVMRELQVTSEQTRTKLQELASEVVSDKGSSTLASIEHQTKRVLQKIVDFEQVFNA